MKRIAILVETSLASGREILTGISRYVDERPDWSIFQHVGPLGIMAPESIRNWQGHGIIARIANPKLLKLIKAKNLPTVDVLGNVHPLAFPLVKCNDHAIGSAVARHFMESAHKNFAYLGLANEGWSLDRERGFRHEITLHQYPLQIFHIEQRPSDHVLSDHTFEAMKHWLKTLRNPVALMVASDQFAPILFEACHQLNLSVPEQISVMGVDNDAPFCNLCRPHLSSVKPDHERVGYLAATTLSKLMEGIPLQQQVTEVDTYTVHRRLSCDYLAIDDTSIIAAVKYIREHATESPSLDDIAEICGLSRSVLQRRFRQYFNHTVGDMILNEKLGIARELLSNTNLPIPIVAERSGFTCQEYMNRIFRKHLNTSPRKYRLF